MKSTTWSGGTTTQLFLFPEHSSYEQRNFDWRISTATIESDHSTFTTMNYKRKLLMLDKDVFLKHENQETMLLSRLEVHAFDGNIPTYAKGKGRDFNVIYKKEYVAEVIPYEVKGKMELKKILKEKDYFSVYCISGRISISFEQDKVELEEGDFWTISDYMGEMCFSIFSENAQWIGTAIYQ